MSKIPTFNPSSNKRKSIAEGALDDVGNEIPSNENKDSKRLNTTSDINQSLNQSESAKRNKLTTFGS